MATELPQRELRNNTAELLRRVERGERLRITVHGHPIADLVPIDRPARFVSFDQVAAGLHGLLAADQSFERDIEVGVDTGAVDPFARYDETPDRPTG